MEEIWKPMPDYPDHYEISNTGLVRSKAVFIPHDGNWDKTQKGYIKKRKLHSSRLNRYGYRVVKLCKYGKCRTLTVHRLVAKSFIPNPNNHTQVNHIDGNKDNNNVNNLEWVSMSENILHAYRMGLIDKEKISCENQQRADLKKGNVVEIIKLLNDNTKIEIAMKYGVGRSTIGDSNKGKTWKDIN